MSKTKERIAGIRADEIGRPVGAYRVELLDPRTGRVKERFDKSNYISPLALNYARWSQAHGFNRGLRYAHLTGATTTFPIGRGRYDLPPTMPVEFIAGLSSDIAEDPASSWATGQVLAYASRWKFSGLPAAGPRGQINEAQSEVTLDGVKVVFDFNEDQGNGAINSLAICRLSQHGATPALSCRVGAQLFGHSLNRLAYQTNYGYVIDVDPATTTIRGIDNQFFTIRSFDYSSLIDADTGEVDMSGLTNADGTSITLSGLTFTSNAAEGPTRLYYLHRPGYFNNGTHVYLAYHGGTQRLNIGKWPVAGGAAVYQTAAYNEGHGSTSSYSNLGIVRIGAYLYAVSSASLSTLNNTRSNVFRCDEATGALSATFPLGTRLDGTPRYSLGGITTDGTDLYVSTNDGILRMDTTGAILEHLGDPSSGGATETGLTPWDTTSNYQRNDSPNGRRDIGGDARSAAYFYDRQTGSGSVTAGNLGTQTQLLGCDGDGRLVGFPGGSDQSGCFASLDGANVFSRSVLASTVNKSASSTMKWTYEITFPSEWRALTTWTAPPS